MQVAPGVHHFNTDPFNWYLIEQGDRLTLVDAGFPGHFGVFVRGVESLGRKVSDVHAVILTHAHADHMGFADRAARAANAPVFIHQADVAASRRVLQLPWFGLLSNAWRPFMAGTLVRATINGVFSAAKVSNPKAFVDGDELDVPGRPRVIHVPGHTAGQVAFHLPDCNVLISGDSVVTRDLYSGASVLPQVPRPRLNDDDRAARQSIERFKDLGRITILPGHGSPWTGDAREVLEKTRAQK